MSVHPLDHPTITARLFHPRKAHAGTSRIPGAVDGTILVDEGIALGYRFYPHQPQSPVILYFHGNGEVARDYDRIVPLFFDIGVSLIVVDYRGYGWSTGSPLASKLLSDAEAVLPALASVFASAGITESCLFVMGRSLGSAPAVHLASAFPNHFKGLIIESGFADMPSVMRVVGIQLERLPLTEQHLAPVGNENKLRTVHLPLLVIHGEDDELLPVDHGQRLYDASPAVNKTILRIPHAGHNDLMMVGMQSYFRAIAAFIAL